MEGNPCYDATAVKQTTDTHLYKTVRGGGEKRRQKISDMWKYIYTNLNVGIVG